MHTLNWSSESEKDKLCNDHLGETAIIRTKEFQLICGDLNGHVKETAGFENTHGGNGFCDRNVGGVTVRILLSENNVSACNIGTCCRIELLPTLL